VVLSKDINKKPKHLAAAKVFFIFIFLSIIFIQASCSFVFFDEEKFSNSYSRKADEKNLKNEIESPVKPNDDYDDSDSKEEYLSADLLYRVTEVIDGDTIKIESGEKIRLIGINSAEDGMQYYSEAKEFLSILVLDREVRLEMDTTDKDIYGRLLRYVFLIEGSDEIFVNEALVRFGFANAYTIYPDIKYCNDFIKAEKTALKNGAGLWEKSKYYDFLSIDLKFNPEGKDEEKMNEEFISLKNNSTQDIDISSWTVKDSGTNIYKFKKAGIIKNEAIDLFTGSGADTGHDFYWNAVRPVWNNDHDRVYIRDSLGLLVHFSDY